MKLAIKNFPNSLNKIQTQTNGRSRSLISKSKLDLYEDRPDLVDNCSKQLPNGWWMGTNYSKQSIFKFCGIIVSVINREYGNQNIQWSI